MLPPLGTNGTKVGTGSEKDEMTYAEVVSIAMRDMDVNTVIKEMC